MKRILVISALALALAQGPALAQDAGKDDLGKPLDEMAEAARRAIESMLDALKATAAKIPMYEAPEVLENGDIIIRRKRDKAGEPEGQTQADKEGQVKI